MKNIVFLVLFVLPFPSTNCFGNLSGPWKGGQLIVDVQGVKEITIVRESLRIDLRPLALGKRIIVHATYLIDHPLPPKDLPLTFITGADSVQGVRCSLSGTHLAFTTTQVVNMPESWKPPAETPGFVPEEQLLYSRRIADSQHEWILFTVPLQTGRQSIEVTYEVEAGVYFSQYHSARFWQTAYILAPARTWKSFGGLDLEVLAPEGWQVKSNLGLTNQGDQWTASFDSLPADFIALTTQHPQGKRLFIFNMSQMLCFFGALTLLLGLRHAIERYRQLKNNSDPGCDIHYSWQLLLVSFFPLALNVLLLIYYNSKIPTTQMNDQLHVIYIGFQAMYWVIFIAPLMMISRLFIWLLCLIGSSLGRRARSKRIA